MVEMLSFPAQLWAEAPFSELCLDPNPEGPLSPVRKAFKHSLISFELPQPLPPVTDVTDFILQP